MLFCARSDTAPAGSVGKATELPGQWRSQTEFGNEDDDVEALVPSA